MLFRKISETTYYMQVQEWLFSVRKIRPPSEPVELTVENVVECDCIVVSAKRVHHEIRRLQAR